MFQSHEDWLYFLVVTCLIHCSVLVAPLITVCIVVFKLTLHYL